MTAANGTGSSSSSAFTDGVDTSGDGEEALRIDLAGTILRANPRWLGPLFLSFAVIAIVAISVAATTEVEVGADGRCRISAWQEVSDVAAESSGMAAEILVTNGTHVVAGTAVLRIDSATISRETAEAQALLALAQKNLNRVTSDLGHGLGGRRSAARAKIRALPTISTDIGGTQRGDAASDDRGPYAVPNDQPEGREEDSLPQEQTTPSSCDHELWHARMEVERLAATVRALSVASERCTVRALTDGYLENLYVRVGDIISAGTVVAHVVPVGRPARATAFVAESDRALLREGLHARITLDGAEPRVINGHVVWLSNGRVTDNEVGQTLGEVTHSAIPLYRVELDIDPPNAEGATPDQVRSGTLGSARFLLGKRRLIQFALPARPPAQR